MDDDDIATEAEQAWLNELANGVDAFLQRTNDRPLSFIILIAETVDLPDSRISFITNGNRSDMLEHMASYALWGLGHRATLN